MRLLDAGRRGGRKKEMEGGEGHRTVQMRSPDAISSTKTSLL